jgi:hypothetical protein
MKVQFFSYYITKTQNEIETRKKEIIINYIIIIIIA